MSDSQITIDLIGDQVRPDTTRALQLGELLTHFEMAIVALLESRGTTSDDAAVVSLIGISSGSNRLLFSVTTAALSAVVQIASGIATRSYATMPRNAHAQLHELSEQASRNGWTLRLSPCSRTPVPFPTVEISAHQPVPPPGALRTVEGTTSVVGRCLRVGGVQPRAEIRLLSGELLYVSISEVLARRMASALYDEVRLDGRARWDADNWQVLSFEVDSVVPIRVQDPAIAFEHLARSARGRWDNVDAAEYVRKIRSRRA